MGRPPKPIEPPESHPDAEPAKRKPEFRITEAADAPTDADPADGSVQQTSNVPGPLPRKD
jgi:hypothetical protein